MKVLDSFYGFVGTIKSTTKQEIIELLANKDIQSFNRIAIIKNNTCYIVPSQIHIGFTEKDLKSVIQKELVVKLIE